MGLRGKYPGFQTNPVTSQTLIFPVCQMGLIVFFPPPDGVPVGTIGSRYQKSNCQICGCGAREAHIIMLRASRHCRDRFSFQERALPGKTDAAPSRAGPSQRAAFLFLPRQRSPRRIPPRFSPLLPGSMATPSPGRAGEPPAAVPGVHGTIYPEAQGPRATLARRPHQGGLLLPPAPQA